MRVDYTDSVGKNTKMSMSVAYVDRMGMLLFGVELKVEVDALWDVCYYSLNGR